MAVLPSPTTGPSPTAGSSPPPGPLSLTRGRRAALAIGVPVCLFLVAFGGYDLLGYFGRGSYPVKYTVPASTRSLDLNLAAGQVLIEQAAVSQATLAGTARYSIFRSTLTERTSNGETAIGYHCPTLENECALDATVTAPAGLPVSASTDGGNATVTGTTGQVALSTGGGDITADHIAGPLRLNTSGGNITATAITSATMTATTGGGNIDVTGLGSATVTAKTSGGNIQATGVDSADLAASTGGGDIEIVFTSVPHNVVVNTSGGSITLVLPLGDVQYDVKAHADSGSVNDLVSQNSLFTQNMITATSGGGDITIRYSNQ